MSDYKEALMEQSFPQLASHMAKLRDEIADQDSLLKNLKGQMKILSEQVLPEKLEEAGFESVTVTVDGVKHRIQTSGQMQVSVPKENKEKLFRWFEETGNEALITETVNSSTLKAFIKEQMKAGEEVPDEIVNIHAYTKASLVKV